MNKKKSDEDFLEEFHNATEEFLDIAYYQINESIANDEIEFYKKKFSEEEIAILIILNKSVFQNLKSFFILSRSNLFLPAFNSVRTAIELMRICRLFILSPNFGKEYMGNENLDFGSPEYAFSQGQILKKLEKAKALYYEMFSDRKLAGSMYEEVLKGSRISEIHSELSKWTHALNLNLLVPLHLNKDRIYLGLEDEDKMYCKIFKKKYTEGSYIIITSHLFFFPTHTFNEEFYALANKMSVLYGEYIERFYK